MKTLASLTQTAGPSATLDRLKAVPPEFWIRLSLAVAALVAVIFVIRKIASMNKLILGVVVFVALTIVGFNWVYERTEPAWATPIVNILAGFLPSKASPPKKPASD